MALVTMPAWEVMKPLDLARLLPTRNVARHGLGGLMPPNKNITPLPPQTK